MAIIPLFNCAFDQVTISAAESVLRSGHLAAGQHVAALEEELCAYLGAGSAVAMGDMTHALTMALQLAGVKPGDEVLTLSYNCLSSNAAITAAGALPVWVDIDPDTASFSVADAGQALSPRTKAVVVYHVAGYPANLAALRSFCDSNGLPLVEDANNAIGASFQGVPVGTTGDFAVFSFYANRQVNAIEGAILVTKSPNDAVEARKLRRFGIDVKSFRDADGEINPLSSIPVIGTSSPLSNFNAVLARRGLQSLSERMRRTRENVLQLEAAVSGLQGFSPVRAVPGALPSYWAWIVQSERRDTLLRDLKGSGIGCSKLHQPNHVYAGFGRAARRLPATERFMARVLAIPCGWWLDTETIGIISSAIRASTLRA